jgi:hypothetical protein
MRVTGGARANLAMSGTWPQMRRVRQTGLRLELYSNSRPQQAPSSGISPVGSSGTVPTFLLQTAARNTSVGPGVKRPWLESGARLKVRELQRLGRGFEMASIPPSPNAGVPGAVGGGLADYERGPEVARARLEQGRHSLRSMSEESDW